MQSQDFNRHLGLPSKGQSHAPSMQLPPPLECPKSGFQLIDVDPSLADRCNALLTPDRDTLPPIRQIPYNSLALIRPDDTPIPPGRAEYEVSALPTRGSGLVSSSLSRSLNSLPSSSTPHTGFGTPCVRNTLPSSYPTHWSSGHPGQRGDQVFPHRGPHESLQASEAAYSGFIHRPHFWNSDTAVPGGPDHLLTPNTSGGAVHYEAGPYPSYAGTRIERSSSRCDMPMAAQAGPHSGHQPLIIPGGVRRYACPPDISAPACYYSSPDYTVPFGTSIPRYPPHQKPLYHHHSVPSGASGSGQCSVPVDENRPSDVSQQRTLYHHHSIPSGASTSGQRLVPSVGPPNRGDEHNNGDQVKDCDQDARYMTPQQSPTRQSVRHGRKGSSTSSTVLGGVDRRSIGLTKGHSDEQASESMGSVSKRRLRDSELSGAEVPSLSSKTPKRVADSKNEDCVTTNFSMSNGLLHYEVTDRDGTNRRRAEPISPTSEKKLPDDLGRAILKWLIANDGIENEGSEND